MQELAKQFTHIMQKTITSGETFSIISIQDRPSGSKQISGVLPHSVKRTSDGEIFTVDDLVTNGTQMRGHITGFNILEGEMFVSHTWSGVGMNLESLFKIIHLPSQFQVGDKVKVFLMPEGETTFPGFTASVIAVHFYEGKVKYDLEIKFAGEFSTRIYNIDSILVSSI